jgi:putative transcriptional regulator
MILTPNIDRHADNRTDMAGRLLVATPLVTDKAFRKSVVAVVAHGERGALGILLNRPANNMTLRRLFVEKDIQPNEAPLGIPIHAGGPADIENAVVLHERVTDAPASTLDVTPTIFLTPEIGIVPRLLRNHGVGRFFIALGHCAWGPGQIEAEIQRGLWLTKPLREDEVFGQLVTDRWTAAMARMQVSPAGFTMLAGRA